MPSSKREKKQYRSKRSVQSASMVQRDSLFETYKRERESSQRSSRNIGSVPQQSYLGRFNDMLKWYELFSRKTERYHSLTNIILLAEFMPETDDPSGRTRARKR